MDEPVNVQKIYFIFESPMLFNKIPQLPCFNFT